MIKLLDDTEWEEKELIDRMYDDSFYYDYLGKASLSSSRIKPLVKSPQAYEKSLIEPISNEKALRDGRLFHTLLLEYENVADRYMFIDSSTRTTKKFKECELENQDKEIMLNKELEQMSYLLARVEANYMASELLREGLAEVPMVGNIFGFPFRGKVDYIKNDLIIDVKTTSSLDGWGYAAKKKWHYDLQAYIYTELFSIQNFTFLVIDKSTSEIERWDVSQETLEIGKQKCELACQRYRDYFYDKTKNVNEFVRRSIL